MNSATEYAKALFELASTTSKKEELLIDLNETLKEIMKYPNSDEYSEEELESYINTIKEYSVKQRISSLKQEMKETLDINKKIEIAKKIENINKEVLKW